MTDPEIASCLNEQGTPISAKQVKQARLKQGWRRRNNDTEQQEQQRQAIRDSISEGTTRNYGRTHLMTALRIHRSHRARKGDVEKELVL